VIRTHRLVSLLAAAMGISLLGPGCGSRVAEQSGPGAASQGQRTTLHALVPCGQVGPFSQIVKFYEKEHPDVTIDWEQENIVTMTKKVIDGKAQPDLFLSMGDLEMDQLEEAGKLVEGTRTKYAENSLAIVVPESNPGGVASIADFAKPSVKFVAIPKPETNAVGKHAREALEKLGIWKQVEKKILLPRFAADSKDLVTEGKVDAAIAYYPCSVEVHVKDAPPTLPPGMKLVGHVRSDLYSPFWCEGAVIKGAKNPEGGRALLEFLKTPEVQQIYKQWQFVREPTESEPAARE
jgi:molybdate transport system substrate-binding protein